MDVELLRVVSNKDTYERFAPYIRTDTLTPEVARVFEKMKDYYGIGNKEVNWSAFAPWYMTTAAKSLDKKSVILYQGLFTQLQEPELMSEETKQSVLEHFITIDYAHKIADCALKIRNGTHGQSIHTIDTFVREWERETHRAVSDSDLFESDDVGNVIDAVREAGLNWRLDELNISCGPLRTGDFVVVGARPETGKTTFLASEVSHMATQVGGTRPIIWVNNEERSSKVKLRIMQAALGWPLADILADPVKATSEYQTLMKMDNRILVTGSSAGMNRVDLLVPLFKKHNPAMIVFDQLDKVAGFARKNDKEDQRLGALYNWARDLAHEYGPVIAASQASDSAEGQQWIWQHQLRGSRTDKAGEADLILTIGMVHEVGKENIRYINVCKNKLFGMSPMFQEKERHGRWEVHIQPELARYRGVK